MSSRWTLNPESFDLLLDWLSPDRALAAERYEVIRAKLIFLFECNGARDPGSLADEVFDRACRRLQERTIELEKDPAAFLQGVARFVLREELKKEVTGNQATRLAVVPGPSLNEERRLACMRTCLKALSVDDRQLFLRYYDGAGGKRIAARTALAASNRMSAGALRIRILRIRSRLEECISKCAASVERNETPRTANQE